jgi:DNA-binding beta-propeller fold protein YncE
MRSRGAGILAGHVGIRADVLVLALIFFLAGCTPGGGLTSLPFGKCKLPDGAQSYGYIFNNDGTCFATPKTIAITSLVTFNLPPDTVKIWNDDGTSFTVSGVVQPQDFSMAAGMPVYMLDNSPSNQRIALIDIQAGKITAQIPLPQAIYSSSAMAVSPDGRFLYVTKGKAELSVTTTPPSVVVVNLTTNKVDTEIALPATVTPQGGIAITPDGAFAYVPVSDLIPGTPITYSVYVIDTAARKVATIIPFPDSAVAVHVAVTPDGTAVYVARQTSLLAIDVLTNTIAANIVFPVPMALNRIVMDPAGRYIYVTNQGPNIAIVDAIANRYLDQIKVAPLVSGSTSLRISGDGRLLYSIDQGDPFVNLIDTGSRSVLSRTRVTTFPVGQTGWNLFDVLPLQ